MFDEKFMIITFKTTHFAMAAERELLRQNMSVELIPVPREISSECGFCLKIPNIDDWQNIQELNIESLWKVELVDLMEKRYEKIL